MATMRGGEGVARVLNEISQNVSKASTVQIGFLEGATYPDGKPVAMIAAIQEWGAPRAGIPPRPFFRNMIAAKSPEWPDAIANLMREHNYDMAKVFALVGEAIAGQLRQSIIETNSPALAQSTIDRKGFSKPLIESGHMLQSVDYRVSRR